MQSVEEAASATDRRGFRPPQALVLAGGAAVLALLTWPIPDLTPGPVGLDPSWQAGLHLAARQGLDFGRDIVFTYGPLGFLGQPKLYSLLTAVLGVAFTMAVHLVWCALLLRTACRFLHPVVGVLLAYAIAAIGQEPAEIATLAAVVLALSCLDSDGSRPHVAGAYGAAAGVLLLVKFNTGVMVGALGAVLVLAAPVQARWRAATAFGGSAVVVVTIAWLATGNPPAAFPAYAIGSLAVASGYTEAMALEAPGRGWEYPASFALALTLVVAVWRWAPPPSRRLRLLTTGVALASGWFLFKRGFTRHDAHSVPLFLALAAAPLAFRWRTPHAVVSAVAWTVLGLMATVAAFDIPWRAHYSPIRHARAGVDQARSLASAEARGRTVAAGRGRILAELAIDPQTMVALGNRPMHVDPVETSAVWALESPWRPVPIFQAYSAYTEHLDGLNAAALRGDDGPDVVLRPPVRLAIDGRNPDFESPGYLLDLLCHYRELSATERWQVLERSAGRCSEPRKLRTDAGKPSGVVVPEPSDADDLVFARIDIDTTVLERVRSLLFKPAEPPSIHLDDRAFRLVRATASGPLLLDVPDTLGYTAPYGGTASMAPPRVLRVRGVTSWRVTFFAVDLAADR